ncbi:MAG: NAD-dependent epimerase/dehydratase family protein [Actinomycetota bacterium]
MTQTKVFVTGVSGFIGSYLAERLLDEGYHVGGLLRQTNRLNYPGVQRLMGRVDMHYGSVTDYHSVAQALREFRPDVIAHLGAVTPVAYSFAHPHEVTDTNYMGVINLSEAALKILPDLKRMIFASSMEVYGHQAPDGPFEETLDPHPACPYAVAKFASEKYLQYMKYAYNFPGVMLRQTNCYGRRENDYFIVERILTQMLKGDTVNLGEKDPVRNFIWITDLLDLYVELIGSTSDEKLHGEVFNTGPDNGLTIGELADEIARQLGWKGRINWNTIPKRPGEIFYLNSSNEKVSKATGWEPKVSLEEGIGRTIEIWRDNLGR